MANIRPSTRKTSIIATLGPASSSEAVIEELVEAGANVFRLNMSHGDASDKKALVEAIRNVETRLQRPLAIMADLQGPKIRVGTFADGPVMLEEGATFIFDMTERPGDVTRVSLPHPELFTAIRDGDEILVDDGKVRLLAESCSAQSITARVMRAGKISDRKGVNLPQTLLPVSAMTNKDRQDLEYILQHDVDWVALSFVQRPEDVAELRKIVQNRAGVLAKIEKPLAVERLDGILELADAVMVARGDLGVECPLEEVPAIQKHIIRTAREAGKAVVVATQMLESMIQASTPTRAEVSDVANAVFDGADAVMLSAESAVGDYPVEAVAMMARIASTVEADPDYIRDHERRQMELAATAEDAISAAARQVAHTVRAAAIVTFTTSGSTALRAAQKRPLVPILVLTPRLDVARKLGLYWGLFTVKTRDVDSFEEMVAKSVRMAIRQGLAKAGDRVVITAGVPFGTPGATNILHIAWVHEEAVREVAKERASGLDPD